MVFSGHIQDGAIVPDEPITLPEGSQVLIQLKEEAEPATPLKPRQGGQCRGQIFIADDFDELPDDIAEAFGMNEP